MTQEGSILPAHRLYTNYLITGANRTIAEELWEKIPTTMGEVYGFLGNIRKTYTLEEDVLEELKKDIMSNMKRLGILTRNVSEVIDNLEQGVFETGQQPNALGGPSLIINKIAYIKSLSEFQKNGYKPLFYVADYDSVQPELTISRVPSPSSRGLLISYPINHSYEGSPIYELPNPSEGWLMKTLDKLKSNYKGLLNRTNRENAIQNLDHALTILKMAYFSTENVSDWAMKTLGTIVNVESDLGIPMLQFSTCARQLFQKGYEILLSEPNRSKFIDASNKAANLVTSLGYKPGIGIREDDYVPFFLECPENGCHKTRIELKYINRTGSSNAIISGKCQKCGDIHEYSVNVKTPDLTDIIDIITPRVDSRQIIVDSVIPIVCHIGGPGETSYYSEVIPAIKALGLPIPLYLRYTRLFYNTPWNEAYAKRLQSKGYPTLVERELFNALRQWVDARNNENAIKLKEAHFKIREFIERVYRELNSEVIRLKVNLDEIKSKLKKQENRATLIKEMRTKQTQMQEIELYLSSALGMFSPEKFGQEVSWAWIDVVVMTGLNDLMGVFLRQYNKNTPNSSMFYANLT